MESLSGGDTCYKNNQREGSTSDKGTKIANGEFPKNASIANTVHYLLLLQPCCIVTSTVQELTFHVCPSLCEKDYLVSC